MKKLKLFALLFFCSGIVYYVIDQNIPQVVTHSLVSQYRNLVSNAPLSKKERDLRYSSEKFYRSTLLRSRFNGGIIVARNGKIVFEAYNGNERVKYGKPIDSATSFHLASVSKTITGMAMLKLLQEKKRSVDEQVQSFIPEFPFTGISVRNLLSHRSGLPNYVYFVEKFGWDTHRFITNADILTMMIQYKTQLDVGRPNAYFDYCNTNYVILALIIERLSGVSYKNYLKTAFFEPLGMNQTFVFSMDQSDQVLPSYKNNNRLETFMFLDAVYGDKNIYSSLRDMVRWDMALYDTVRFPLSMQEEAFKGYSYERKGVKNYGLGWRLYELPTGKKIVYHNGWWHGNNTVFSRLPQDSTVIIVLGNRFNRSIYQAKRIAGIFDGYGIDLQEDD
ncbi:MAG: serine hydrolase domain-containing protein [Bacteroidota bacterium]